MDWSVTMTAAEYQVLASHLHRGDDDEHAAFCYAGVAQGASHGRLLVRRIVLVPDDDFPLSSGKGYRSIAPPGGCPGGEGV
jgi:hypothetical protein